VATTKPGLRGGSFGAAPGFASGVAAAAAIGGGSDATAFVASGVALVNCKPANLLVAWCGAASGAALALAASGHTVATNPAQRRAERARAAQRSARKGRQSVGTRPTIPYLERYCRCEYALSAMQPYRVTMRRSSSAPRLLSFALLAASSWLGIVACKEHPYRHDVSGTVVDMQGRGIGKCQVARVTDKGEPYGHDELYLRTTDANGQFRFESSGMGPSPLASAPWHLKVTLPVGPSATFDLVAPWSDNRATCFGYCKRDVELRMTATTP
jgi:hypothetical protein